MWDAVGSYLISVLIGLDVFANAILAGKRYQMISCRIGESIDGDGWAARVPWPESWVKHFRSAVYVTVV